MSSTAFPPQLPGRGLQSSKVGYNKNHNIILMMSTTSLEHKLKQLQDESQAQSQLLTQRLAESQSGQNLLHMSTRLSAVPPSLHALLQQLHPLVSQVEQSEKHIVQQLDALVQHAQEMRLEDRRSRHAMEATELVEDLFAAETALQRFRQQQQQQSQLLKTGTCCKSAKRCCSVVIAAQKKERTVVPGARNGRGGMQLSVCARS